MRKFACFVEGATELDFIVRLVSEMAGHRGFKIESTEMFGRSPTRFSASEYSDPAGDRSLLIYNCGSDNSVLSAIREQYAGLVREGYECVLGLRDVYPHARADIAQIRLDITGRLPVGTVPCRVILSVMEIEAWFIADHTHLRRIDARLTRAYVHAKLGIDISPANVESFDHPTATLRRVYGLAGTTYRKGKRRALRTLDNLDYADLYVTHSAAVPALGALCGALDAWF